MQKQSRTTKTLHQVSSLLSLFEQTFPPRRRPLPRRRLPRRGRQCWTWHLLGRGTEYSVLRTCYLVMLTFVAAGCRPPVAVSPTSVLNHDDAGTPQIVPQDLPQSTFRFQFREQILADVIYRNGQEAGRSSIPESLGGG